MQRAREKENLAYWYPDISAVLVCQLVRGATLGPYKLQVHAKEAKGGCGRAMTGLQLCEAACAGDAAKVSTLLSTQGAQSFINYQDEHGRTLLHDATIRGHETVTEQLIVAC